MADDAASFRDRRDAGRTLARLLLPRYGGREDVLVLGLPRGGIPVAAEVARALGAPLDACVVRKLGVPGREELAMGAIAPDGTHWLDREVVASLGGVLAEQLPPGADNPDEIPNAVRSEQE